MRRQLLRRRARALATRQGFTLLELMIVMGIIVMLAGLAVAALLNANDDAMEGVAKIKAAQYAEACKQYKIKVGFWPQQLPDLAQRPQNVSEKKWRRPFVDKLEADPWGNQFTLQTDAINNKVRVTSFGPDGKTGTEDDVSSDDV